MRKIEWYCDTGFAGCRHEGTFEVEDDYTDEEISDYVYEEIMNYLSFGWKEVEE